MTARSVYWSSLGSARSGRNNSCAEGNHSAWAVANTEKQSVTMNAFFMESEVLVIRQAKRSAERGVRKLQKEKCEGFERFGSRALGDKRDRRGIPVPPF